MDVVFRSNVSSFPAQMKILVPLLLLCLLPGCAEISDSLGGDVALHPSSGVPQYEKARALFKFSAEHGDAMAQLKYAAMCLAGLGGPTDAREAWRNLLAADRQGVPMAAILIADIYTTGNETLGIARDFDRALAYARKADPRGNGDRIALIQRLQRGESPEVVIMRTPRRARGSDGPPEIIKEVEAIVPVTFQVLDLSTKIIVDLRVTPEGLPVEVSVITPTTPQFEAAIVSAVSQFKFLPGTEDGHPVMMHIRLPIEFSMK